MSQVYKKMDGFPPLSLALALHMLCFCLSLSVNLLFEEKFVKKKILNAFIGRNETRKGRMEKKKGGVE